MPYPCTSFHYSMAICTWAYILNVVHFLSVCMDTLAANNSVRLYGGSSNKEGVVQIMVAERWRTICNDGWDALDALVTCRQLGYVEGFAMLFNDDYYIEPLENGEVFIMEGNNFACEGTEQSLLSCKYTQYSGYCRKRAGVVCDITPNQFYEMLAKLNSYEPLTFSIGPNGHSTGRVLAVQRQQYTGTLITGGVCKINGRAASLICGKGGYESGGKPTRQPHLKNLPMLGTAMVCDQDTTLRQSVIRALAFAFVSATFIIILGSIAIHRIRRGRAIPG